MLAGIEEALCAAEGKEVKAQMSAADALLTGLIDYAGLYPPAGLAMDAAVRNYLRYAQGPHAGSLGRFVVSVSRLPELLAAAGGALREIPLSILAATEADCDGLERLMREGFRVEAVEIKAETPEAIRRLRERAPADGTIYCEVPVGRASIAALDALAELGMRAKLRMGGVVAEAIPGAQDVAEMLAGLAERRVAFKATAGLHHAVRGRYALTYEPGSATGVMHGFLNLTSAAAMMYFGGEGRDAQRVLEDGYADAWRMTEDTLAWRGVQWSAEQVRSVREEFFAGFGSCSFEEPLNELEARGWM